MLRRRNRPTGDSTRLGSRISSPRSAIPSARGRTYARAHPGAVRSWVVYPLWATDRNLRRAKTDLAGLRLPGRRGPPAEVLEPAPTPRGDVHVSPNSIPAPSDTPTRKQLAEAKRLNWVPEYIELEQSLLGGKSTGRRDRLRLNSDSTSMRSTEDRLLFEALVERTSTPTY